MSAILDKSRPVSFDEDQILVERFLGGDQAGFELLYAKYYDKVFSIARGVLFDHDEAADAVQEVFTLVYRNLRRFDQRSRFSTWLFRVAVNRSIQEARKHRYRSRQSELVEAASEPAAQVESPDIGIAESLAKLKPADRAILVLFYWEELSLNEIAESLGCNMNAAKTRLYRARERFRAAYEEPEV